MPTLINLKGDKDFYGTLKPKGNANPYTLEKAPPPPNPMSNVPLTNNFQRQQATERLSDLSDFNAKEKPVSTDELGSTNMKKLENQDDSITGRVKSFIDNPFNIDITKEDEEGRTWRGHKEKGELVKTTKIISTEGIADVGSIALDVVQPITDSVSDLGSRALSFAENKAFNIILLLGGLYIVSQFASGLGQSAGAVAKSKAKGEE